MLAIHPVGGKMLVFQAAVPNVGVGKVKQREVVTAYGTEREAALRQPEDAFFKRFAADCSSHQVRRLDLVVRRLGAAMPPTAPRTRRGVCVCS